MKTGNKTAPKITNKNKRVSMLTETLCSDVFEDSSIGEGEEVSKK